MYIYIYILYKSILYKPTSVTEWKRLTVLEMQLRSETCAHSAFAENCLSVWLVVGSWHDYCQHKSISDSATSLTPFRRIHRRQNGTKSGKWRTKCTCNLQVDIRAVNATVKVRRRWENCVKAICGLGGKEWWAVRGEVEDMKAKRLISGNLYCDMW